MKLYSRTKVVPTKRRGTRVQLAGTAGAAALMVMAVAGCGGDAQEQAPAAGTEAAPASPSEAAATSEAPQAGTPAEESPGVDDEAATTQPPNGTGDNPDDEAAEEVVITISDFAYDLPDTIAPGTEVTIRNEDQVGHTVTSDEEGVFDVLVGGGQEETFIVPDEPGEYSFFCRPHPNMVDTLVIG